jgi:hypothetical protein
MDWLRECDFLMAHFVELDNNNVVISGIVVHNNELLIDGVENEQKGIDFCVAYYGGTWIQTSYNANFRKNYAGNGYNYDEVRDAFIAPQPYLSWILNDTNCQWKAPVDYPIDGGTYKWNEATGSWDATEL